MEKKNIRSKLVEARTSRAILKLRRRFEKWPAQCVVLDLGPKFVLVSCVDEHIRFNGFECIRVEDIRSVQEHPSASFVEAVLSKRGERRPKKPRVSLRSTSALLSSANRAFPLVTVQTDLVHPDECFIGRVVKVNPMWLSLLEISPQAKWERRPTILRVGQITRIEFGDGYSAALHLVGGDPQPLKPSR
ncbi:MAG: hypothetical protein HUU28_10575 [Planctomycetaceae bacterium]|nr:hypothetical protein [Planctomycetaceae bacterium]